MQQNSIVKTFLDGLSEHLPEEDKVELSYATGASSEQLVLLQQTFSRMPFIADRIIIADKWYLLASIWGTHH